MSRFVRVIGLASGLRSKAPMLTMTECALSLSYDNE